MVRSNNSPNELSDGTTLEHIIPLIGKGWTTISYPNGDRVVIGAKEIDIRRGKEEATIPKKLG